MWIATRKWYDGFAHQLSNDPSVPARVHLVCHFYDVIANCRMTQHFYKRHIFRMMLSRSFQDEHLLENVMLPSREMPTSDLQWEILARGLIKAHMKLTAFGYRRLSEELAGLGVHETEANVRNRVNRGRFTAIYLLQCLTAMDVAVVVLPARRGSAVKASRMRPLA